MNAVIARMVLCLCVSVIAAKPGFAEEAVNIHSDGSIQLDTGEVIALAGIVLVPESLNLLRVMVLNQEIEIESAEFGRPSDGMLAKPVYLYVKTSEIKFPFKSDSDLKTHRLLVNQAMLQFGAARVDGRQTHPYRDRFVKAQAEAQEHGEGIWSYSEGL